MPCWILKGGALLLPLLTIQISFRGLGIVLDEPHVPCGHSQEPPHLFGGARLQRENPVTIVFLHRQFGCILHQPRIVGILPCCRKTCFCLHLLLGLPAEVNRPVSHPETQIHWNNFIR